MSRVQTRIPDHRIADFQPASGRGAHRPTVVRQKDRPAGPSVTIQLIGQLIGQVIPPVTGPMSTGPIIGQTKEEVAQSVSSPSASLRAADQGRGIHRHELPSLQAGEILECHYHLMDFDGYEIQQSGRRPGRLTSPGFTRSNRSNTLRRRRRGAVIGRGGLGRQREVTMVQPTIAAIENSVVWQTSGKGDTDFGVHFFERREARDHQPLDLYRPYQFRTVCPNSPLTYHGQLLSITWLVRVRVFLSTGDSLTFEQKFDLLA